MTYNRDDKTIKALGKQIRKLREERKMSMEDLADKAGLVYSQIGRIERGEINTSVSHVAVIAKALKVELKELFDF